MSSDINMQKRLTLVCVLITAWLGPHVSEAHSDVPLTLTAQGKLAREPDDMQIPKEFQPLEFDKAERDCALTPESHPKDASAPTTDGVCSTGVSALLKIHVNVVFLKFPGSVGTQPDPRKQKKQSPDAIHNASVTHLSAHGFGGLSVSGGGRDQSK